MIRAKVVHSVELILGYSRLPLAKGWNRLILSECQEISLFSISFFPISMRRTKTKYSIEKHNTGLSLFSIPFFQPHVPDGLTVKYCMVVW